MCARHIECTWREGQPSARLIVLQIVSAEFFVFGQTKCIAVNPDGARPDLEAFRWLVGRSWSNYPAAVLEIHKALRGHQAGVREYELFETYVVPDEPLAGEAFPKVGSRRSKAQRGGERYDVRYSAEPEVAMLPVSMLASDVCPVTNRPRSDGKWIKVGECRPIVPVRLSKEDAAMGLLTHMPDGRYHPPNHKSGKGKKRARDADGFGATGAARERRGEARRAARTGSRADYRQGSRVDDVGLVVGDPVRGDQARQGELGSRATGGRRRSSRYTR